MQKTNSEYKLSRTESEAFSWTVYITIVFMTLFYGFLFNYFFSMYLQDFMTSIYNATVKSADVLGVDAHFIRLIILVLFEERDSMRHYTPLNSILKDMLMIFFIIVPMFIIGMRFWTAPTYLKYDLKINAMVAPFGIFPAFFSYHDDIKALGAVVMIMNMYVFYHHLDPPYDDKDGNGYKEPWKYYDSDEDDRRYSKYDTDEGSSD